MSRTASAAALILLAATVLAGVPLPAAPAASAEAAPGPLASGLAFEPNLGQLGDGVAFAARAPGFSLLVGETGALTAVGANDARVTLRFDGASPRSVHGSGQLPGRVHYLLGSDSAAWVSDVPRFARVVLDDAWPGIDVLLREGPDGAPEYDLLVAPHADLSRAAIAFDGAAAALAPDGSIRAGALVQRAPVAWQERAGEREPLAAGFVAAGSGFRVEVDGWDASLPLVIDPILASSSYLGGTGDDRALEVAATSDGGAVIAGSTTSASFPTLNPLQPARAGARDAMVARFAADGSLVFATYLGGAADDVAESVAIAADGTIVVGGTTSSANFPVASAYQGALRGRTDAFLAKLAADGGSLAWSTYLGGGTGTSNGAEAGLGVAVGPDGSVALVGTTESPDFPVRNAVQVTKSTAVDAFASVFAGDGSALFWSTYLGGNSHDGFAGAAFDGLGRLTVAGTTQSTNFPTVAPLDSTFNGIIDTMIARFAFGGASLEYSTYLGGAADDTMFDVAVDGAGAAHVTGRTWSEDFPMVAPLQPYANEEHHEEEEEEEHAKADAFVVKLLADGSALAWGTWLGATGFDEGRSIAVGPTGEVAVAGRTESFNFPTVAAVQTEKADPGLFIYDAFVARYPADGSAVDFSTYLGGRGAPTLGEGAAFATDGSVLLAGYTGSAYFPTTAAHDTSWNGGNDAILVRFGAGSPVPPGAPRELLTTPAGRGQVLVRWQAPFYAGGAVLFKYAIHAGPTPETLAPYVEIGGRYTMETHGGLGDGTYQCYRVIAWSVAGWGTPSDVSCTTTWVRPSAPAGVSAEPGPGLTQVTVDWLPPATGGVQTYRIYRGFLQGSEDTLVAEVAGVRRSFTDSPPVPGVTYWYRVAAWNPAGEGVRSAGVSAMALAPPLP